jgi:hypothetical protein
VSLLYIEEFSTNAKGFSGPLQVPEQPADATQVVDFSLGVAQSAQFNASTMFVRIHTDVVCSRLFGSNPTATTVSPRMGAGDTEYHGVTPGLRVSVIANA